MSNVVLKPAAQAPTISEEQREILKRTLFKGFSDDEVAFCMAVCARTGLDPFLRQIHFKRVKDHKSGEWRIVIMTGIDGFRLSANRSQIYAGSDEVVFELDEKGLPTKATATVYKMISGERCPFTASVRWVEFYPGEREGFMWRKMPFQMLGKCAEAQALRKGFPVELSGIYLPEEMEQADHPHEMVPSKAEKAKAALIESIEADESSDFEDSAAEVEVGPGDYVIPVGANKGKRLSEVGRRGVDNFLTWFDSEVAAGKKMGPGATEYAEAARAFLEVAE